MIRYVSVALEHIVESKTCQFELRHSAFFVPPKLEKFYFQIRLKRVLALASGMAESDLET